MDKLITVITPTTGKKSLSRLIESLDSQSMPLTHILLWDDKRDDDFLYPSPETLKINDPHMFNNENRYSVVVPGSFVQGKAYGSSLRSVGLMLARTEFVTFADDDVWWEQNHLENMLNAITENNTNWAYCRRKIWTGKLEYLGVDNFESVGNSPDKKVPYEMVDNNCMIFRRRFGTSGAVIYRETEEYNDDRLYYAFLTKYAGIPNKMTSATVNQVCPARLEKMFRQYCTKNQEEI